MKPSLNNYISANCLPAPTDAAPKYSSGDRGTSPCSTACLMAQNAGHIAQPCRRGRSFRSVCGDSDPCTVFELNHLEPAFFRTLVRRLRPLRRPRTVRRPASIRYAIRFGLIFEDKKSAPGFSDLGHCDYPKCVPQQRYS